MQNSFDWEIPWKEIKRDVLHCHVPSSSFIYFPMIHNGKTITARRVFLSVFAFSSGRKNHKSNNFTNRAFGLGSNDTLTNFISLEKQFIIYFVIISFFFFVVTLFLGAAISRSTAFFSTACGKEHKQQRLNVCRVEACELLNFCPFRSPKNGINQTTITMNQMLLWSPIHSSTDLMWTFICLLLTSAPNNPKREIGLVNCEHKNSILVDWFSLKNRLLNIRVVKSKRVWVFSIFNKRKFGSANKRNSRKFCFRVARASTEKKKSKNITKIDREERKKKMFLDHVSCLSLDETTAKSVSFYGWKLKFHQRIKRHKITLPCK